jgi:hypothetical protein
MQGSTYDHIGMLPPPMINKVGFHNNEESMMMGYC